MVRMSISQMNNKLVELNNFFVEKSQEFTYKISLHQGKLTQKDFFDFQQLIDEIKQQSIRRIKNFVDDRFSQRCQTYETQITTYTQHHEEVQDNLAQFSKYLEDSTIQLKAEQNRKQILFEHFSKKYSRNCLIKKAWKAMHDYKVFRQQQKDTQNKMDRHYEKNLMKKSFFPWRTLTYKEGYENTVKKQTHTDVMNIHEQYKGIIEILKAKITQTDNLTKVKKAAKGQFTYALSKNLLKTISNLSIQVMSLNQMSLRDQQFANQSTQKFISEVDYVIKQKLQKVRQYKREISGQNQEKQNDGARRKKITFL